MENQEIKKVREARNSALETMESIHNEFEGKELSEDAQKRWDDAKSTYESKTKILNREEMLEAKRKENSMRNHNDGADREMNERFSFKDAVQYAVNPNKMDSDKRGFYAEMSAEAERQATSAGVTLQGGQGIVLPSNIMRGQFRNDVDVSTEGADLVFDEKGSFIEYLNENLVLADLGAEVLDGLVGDIRMPRESNQVTFTWEGETDPNAESTPTYDQVKLSPNRGGTFIDISNQLMKQTSPAIESRIRNQIFGSARRGLEQVAIKGVTNSPTGILDSATQVASGSSVSRDVVIDLESQVASDNADRGSLAYLTNSKARGILKKTASDAGSGIFVWEGNEMNGYRAEVSNLVLESAGYSPLIFGNFADLLMGMWGGMEILVDPYTQATNGITRLVLNIYADVALMHDKSFAYFDVATP